MSLFDASPGRRRIAAFAFHEFPLVEQTRIYAQLDALAGPLGAEWRFVHEVAADPATLPPALRARCGTGLLCMQDRLQHRNDVEHLRATLGGRFDALVDTLQATAQCSRAAILTRPEFQAAASIARWTRGYAPDLIVSFGLGEAAMQALIASWLLDVPRVHVLDRLDGDGTFALLLPLHVAQSALLVGAALAPRLGMLEADDTPAAELQRALHALATRHRVPGRVPLGPHAAFRTASATSAAEQPAAPPGTRPFLLLSTERTGSTMLLGALDSRPTVACAGELFNRQRIAAGELDWLHGATDDRQLLALRLAAPGALHRRLLEHGGALGASAVGCKLLYGHGLVDDRVVDHFADDATLVVVHLTRRDRLRRYLSLARAQRRDRWYAASSTTPRPDDEHGGAIELSPRELAADFAITEQLEARYRAVFADRDPIELDYQDLIDAPQHVTDTLGQRLDLTLPPLRPRSRKTGTDALHAAMPNLGALRAAFAATRWAALFDDAAPTAPTTPR